MHYVKQFKINGVDTKQVGCIELQGRPNAATEGAVGVLGIDILSPTHEVYKCVAVNGSVYTWELLSAGMSIISATISGEGGETKSFPYSNLLAPDNYLIKVGDLILDSEGYLYQITAIGNDSCDTKYCGTQIGGIASGDKNCTLRVKDGKLQLVTESGNVVSSLDFFTSDEETIYRNPESGEGRVIAVRTINNSVLKFFLGTEAQYNELTDAQKNNLFPIITYGNTGNLLADMSPLPVERGGTGQTSVDTYPISGSAKLITSGGVFEYVPHRYGKYSRNYQCNQWVDTDIKIPNGYGNDSVVAYKIKVSVDGIEYTIRDFHLIGDQRTLGGSVCRAVDTVFNGMRENGDKYRAEVTIGYKGSQGSDLEIYLTGLLYDTTSNESISLERATITSVVVQFLK